MLENIQIPDLICPFPSALSPYTEAVQENINGWMESYHLLKTELAVKRFKAGKFAWTTGRAHPTASFEDILLVATWMSWLFMLDDLCDEEELGRHPERLQALHTDLIQHMNHPKMMTAEDSNIISSLIEIWGRMRTQATPQWVERFMQTFDDYARGCLWEANNRARNIIPSAADYMEMRRLTSALYIFFDLIELADHIQLPAEVLDHDSVRQLKLLANDGVAWFNDIVSLEKELRTNDVHNLVIVLQHEHQLTLQQAIDNAAQIFNERIQLYCDLEAQVPSFGTEIDGELARYLAGLRYWVRGNIDWSYETGRYGQTSKQPVSQK
ncbi:MAG: hypothetical protein ABI947_09595 [Chloroflexota bacterium]